MYFNYFYEFSFFLNANLLILKKYFYLHSILKNQLIKKPITILHPGPINRGVEITSEVADSENAIILDQVENGVAIRMAVIYLLASKIKNITN